MRIFYILSFLLALSLPAAAAEPDQNLKQEIAKLVSTYSENFNKKDPAGIASLYAGGGMLINTAGVQTDIAKYYEGAFKAGVDHLEGAVHQVWPLSGDMSLATGESRITGKNESGAPIDQTIIWTAVDVREGGQWKIRMLTAFPKPPPPQQATK
jgi:uncharacterized protein (TIGR02246 family)